MQRHEVSDYYRRRAVERQWCDDIGKAYWAGVADGRRKSMGWADFVIGLLLGACVAMLIGAVR